MQIVYKHENKVILHSAKNILELHNVDCFIKNEHSASIGGNLGLSNAAAELWVRDSGDAEKATTILENEFANTSSIASWTCKQCGEENDGSFEICWKCQSDATAT